MRYTPCIILIIIANCSNLLPADITCAQFLNDKNTPIQKNINNVPRYDSSYCVLNVLTGKVWKGGKTQEGDLIENIEQGQTGLYFTGKCGGIISKDINRIDIKNNRYINFSFVICDFENIKERDYEANIYSINIKLINTDGDTIVEKYIEFPNDIDEKAVSVDLREFSHFIDTNTLINNFVFFNPTYPGKWGFKEITITAKPTGILLRYDGYGYAPEEREGTSLIPQPFISKNVINQNNNLIKEGDICPNEGTVYNDNGGILSLFGYDIIASSRWIDLVIPDELIIDIKEKPIMSLDIKTEADIFNFYIMIKNTDGEFIVGDNNDNMALIEVQNKGKEWENYKIDLREKISNKISNTKIKSIRFCELEGKEIGQKNKNYYEIELTGLSFDKEEK